MSMNGGSLFPQGGSRRSRSDRSRAHNRPVKHTNRHRTGRKGMRGGEFGSDAGLWSNDLPSAAGFVAPLNALSVPHQASPMPSGSLLEGLGPGKPHVKQLGGSSGGHRCSMRHTRTKRTRKAHAGRRSRKHKSRGKKYGMSLKGIFGKS